MDSSVEACSVLNHTDLFVQALPPLVPDIIKARPFGLQSSVAKTGGSPGSSVFWIVFWM